MMRSTDKSTELEKQVSYLRSKTVTFQSRITAKGARVENLISFRQPLRNLVFSASNAVLCSMLYSDDSFIKQLTKVRAGLKELCELNEKKISSRFQMRGNETASTAKLRVMTRSLPLKAECTDGYTGYHDGNKVVPVYFLHYANVADVSGFVHSDYSIWFKSGKEFSTGFAGWPTEHNWKSVHTYKELMASIEAAIKEDGLA